MPWSPDHHALRGRIALVAGATRGAGRGIAAALGEVGATVICTGRSSVTSPGGSDYWLRSEMMLDAFGVTEANWAAALEADRADGYSAAPEGFATSESPRYVGRAVAALAAGPGRARWNQQSVTAAELARDYGFTDIDGSQPDAWARYGTT